MIKHIHIHLGDKKAFKDAVIGVQGVDASSVQQALNKSYRGMKVNSVSSPKLVSGKISVSANITDDLGQTESSTVWLEVKNGQIVDADW